MNRSHNGIGLALCLTLSLATSCGSSDADFEQSNGVFHQQQSLKHSPEAVMAGTCVPSGGLVDDGGFDQSLSCWVANVHMPGSALISTINDPDRPGNTILRVKNFVKQDFYKVQFYQEDRTIALEHCYCLSFRAKSSGLRAISAQVYQGGPPWASYGLWVTPRLLTSWKPEVHCFISSSSATDARVGFNFGDNVGTVWIDNIELDDIGAIDDLDACPP